MAAYRRPGTPASYALFVLVVAVCGAFAQPVHPAANRHLSTGAVHRRLLNSSSPAASTAASKPLAGTGNSTADQNSQIAPAAKAPELAAGLKNGQQAQPADKAVAQPSPEAKQLPVLAAALDSSAPKQQQATQAVAAHSQHSTEPQPAAAVQGHAEVSTKVPAAAASPSTGASVGTAHSPSASNTGATEQQEQHTPQPSSPTTAEEEVHSAPSTQEVQATAETAAVHESVASAAALAEDYEIVPGSGNAQASDAAAEGEQPADAGDAGAEEDVDSWTAINAAEPSSGDWVDSWDDAADAEAEGMDALDGEAPAEEWSVTWASTAPDEDAASDTDAAADGFDVPATADDLAADSDLANAELHSAEADAAADTAQHDASFGTAESAVAGEAGEGAQPADALPKDHVQAQGQHTGEQGGSKLLLAAYKSAAKAFVATAASYRFRDSHASRKASPASSSAYSFLLKPKEHVEDYDAVSEWLRKNKIKPKVSKRKPSHDAAKQQAAPYSSSSNVLAEHLYDASSDPELDDQSERPVHRHTPQTNPTRIYQSQQRALSIVGDQKWRLINIDKEEDIVWLRAGVREYNRNHDKPVFVLAWVP